MFSTTKIISVLAALAISSPGAASIGEIEFQSTPIVDIAIGDKGENLEAVTQYSNGCYEPWFSLKGVKENKLVLVHIAQYFTDTICTRALEFKKLKFNVEGLDNGKYKVVDGNDGDLLGVIKKTDEDARLLMKN